MSYLVKQDNLCFWYAQHVVDIGMKIAYIIYMNKAVKKKIVIGKNMAKALKFANDNKGWHSYSHLCYSTVQAIRKLESHGLVETNKFYQFRRKQK